MNLISLALLGRHPAIFICLTASIVCASDATAKSPISLDVLRRDGYGSVQLVKGYVRNKLYVPAAINGKKVELLLDTGFSSNGITLGSDPSKFGVTPQKGVEVGFSVTGTKSVIGHGIAKSVVMGNVQVQNTPIYFGRFFDNGFLGYGFLKRSGAIIDLTNLRLYMKPGGGRRVNLGPALTSMGLAEAPLLDTKYGNFVVNVEVNGVPTQMTLDTGAQASLLDLRFAKAAGAKGWGRRHVYERDVAGVVTEADFAGTKSFKIEGVPIRTPTVFLGRFALYESTRGKVAGVLGLDVLGLNWGIIDVAQQKFYFARAR
jgi:hypothetical protein